ncbi:MAG: M15 family metallopeptidase [Terracoccus sp.]
MALLPLGSAVAATTPALAPTASTEARSAADPYAAARESVEVRRTALAAAGIGSATGAFLPSGTDSGFQSFTGGGLYSFGGEMAYWVRAAQVGWYASKGGVAGSVGWPRSDARVTTGSSATSVQDFQRGHGWYTPAGSFSTEGGIDRLYASILAERSGLGLPTQEMRTITGGWSQRFARGHIWYGRSTGGYPTYGGIDAVYSGVGGPASGLGYPTGVMVSTSSSWYQWFSGGKILYPRSGAPSVLYTRSFNADVQVVRPSVYLVDWHRISGTVRNGASTPYGIDVLVGGTWSRVVTAYTSSAGRFDAAVRYGQGTTGTWTYRVVVGNPPTGVNIYSRALTATRVAMLAPTAYGRDSRGNPTNPQPLPYSAAAVTNVPAWEWSWMLRLGMWRAGCSGSYADFRRVDVPYFGFDGQTHRGWIIMRKDMMKDTPEVFNYLYSKRFPIQRVEGVVVFGGSDVTSEYANNSSGMNCRLAGEIGGTPMADSHATGRAFDINPVQNPWKRYGSNVWEPTTGTYWSDPAHRTAAYQQYGVVTVPGLVYDWFTARGYRHGASGTPDLMHFDTGYPSVYQPGHRVGCCRLPVPGIDVPALSGDQFLAGLP